VGVIDDVNFVGVAREYVAVTIGRERVEDFWVKYEVCDTYRSEVEEIDVF
jgi:hypothetical protein